MKEWDKNRIKGFLEDRLTSMKEDSFEFELEMRSEKKQKQREKDIDRFLNNLQKEFSKGNYQYVEKKLDEDIEKQKLDVEKDSKTYKILLSNYKQLLIDSISFRRDLRSGKVKNEFDFVSGGFEEKQEPKPVTEETKPVDGDGSGEQIRDLLKVYLDEMSTTNSMTLRTRLSVESSQVEPQKRLEREEMFRRGDLPLLYCSPTMELGVDISDLNVVNMRNIPPTPANYAQRSGRAGRGGEPALVFTYCALGSPHDQHYFKRPEDMVAGVVEEPRIDLKNEDLLRSHVYAIWLAEASLDLKSSLKDLLNLTGDNKRPEINDTVLNAFQTKLYKERAIRRANEVINSISDELQDQEWFQDSWVTNVVLSAQDFFDRCCDRWRTLYLSALSQAKKQNDIIQNPNASQHEKKIAERLRSEAESQLNILLDSENHNQSEFYSYRYFASEGFLPGYSFPRLPISAFVRARKSVDQNDTRILISIT